MWSLKRTTYKMSRRRALKNPDAFQVSTIEGYKEDENLKLAIMQHEKQTKILNEMIEVIEERVAELKLAVKEDIFKTTSEYDKYIKGKEIVDEIEKRKMGK
jgi:hypothetical protein